MAAADDAGLAGALGDADAGARPDQSWPSVKMMLEPAFASGICTGATLSADDRVCIDVV